ncbi:hypothetical protein P368_16675 [Comamonas thiooxydans]|nr:hypothetical protein P369_14940 [Comamonas thiooxydans]KGG97340.1 hypothetical protein P367_16265 [Comamonas thiooxydans]KGH01124.1 hypothetical protein P365_20680 [Comamonas thiooxydans]KGH10193.1 hypothetical protein P368_16675 [Comamonas thiooxydans]GGH66323.1 hypothetical protein GCM10010975_35020 [Comamonas phosphati]
MQSAHDQIGNSRRGATISHVPEIDASLLGYQRPQEMQWCTGTGRSETCVFRVLLGPGQEIPEPTHGRRYQGTQRKGVSRSGYGGYGSQIRERIVVQLAVDERVQGQHGVWCEQQGAAIVDGCLDGGHSYPPTRSDTVVNDHVNPGFRHRQSFCHPACNRIDDSSGWEAVDDLE